MLTFQQFLDHIHDTYGSKYKVLSTIDEWSWSSKSIKLCCEIHGSFARRAYDIVRWKWPCPSCGKEHRRYSNQSNGLIKRLSLEDHVRKFRQVHGDRYTYPEQSFKNSRSKIQIICDDHGPFYQHIHAHIRGTGCRSCRWPTKLVEKKDGSRRAESVRKANKLRATSNLKFIEKARAKHGDGFTYDLENFDGLKSTIKITCPIHGEFKQKARTHLSNAYGCPACSNAGTSIKEKSWLDRLGVCERQIPIKIGGQTYIVDGLNPELNVIYEFLGDYWHGNKSRKNWETGINRNNKISFKELFLQTEERLKTLFSAGYQIYYLWESDFDSKVFEPIEFKGCLLCR